MHKRTLASVVLSSMLLWVPAGALALEHSRTDLPEDRFVLSIRADFAQISSHDEVFGGGGGGLALHIPLGDSPFGAEIATGFAYGGGHWASTTDATLRYYLGISGEDGTHSLQPFLKGGVALSIVGWDEQDTGTTVGGVFGAGMHIWTTESVGMLFDISYRILGGDELRQVFLASLGISFGL